MASVTDISASLSEEMRLRIAALLADSVLCVKCLVSALKSPQPTVSRHLSVLRKAGMVKSSRKGMHSYYSIDFRGDFGPLKRKLIAAYHKAVEYNEPYKSDRKRLNEVARRCDIDCVVPSSIKGKRGNKR
jgi:ArsR family transcriptional regulator